MSSSAKTRSSDYMMLKSAAAASGGVNEAASSNNNTNNNNSNVAISIGDGWCSFPDLDNFDSTRLLKALTLKEEDSCDSIWDPRQPTKEAVGKSYLSVSALRQLEALFNLSQLLYGLSRGDVVNHTFRDIQLGKPPHTFRRSGFTEIGTSSSSRINFYELFEQLSCRIVRESGLAVTMLIYKNPVLPMARQKCLDLISNIATVTSIAFQILEEYDWFIDHLLIMIRDGEFVSDKIPAMCVLIRLLKVILTQRILSEYMKLVDIDFIDCLLDVIEKPLYVQQIDMLPFFVKFEFISMQCLTVLVGDAEYCHLWSEKCRTRLINYCLVSLLLSVAVNPTRRFNHIAYAEQHSNKHSLAHTIMTITELFKCDFKMKSFYFNHKPFKQLIIRLYKKYGAKSVYIVKDPGISYALNHLMRELYIKNRIPSSTSSSSVGTQGSGGAGGGKRESLKYSATKLVKPERTIPEETSEPRKCTYMPCKNEETPFKPFKECSGCNGKAAYCSSKCKKLHSSYHFKYECEATIGSAGGGQRGAEAIYGALDADFPANNKKMLTASQSLRNKTNLYERQGAPVPGGGRRSGKESSRRASDTFDHLNRAGGVVEAGEQRYESTSHASRTSSGRVEERRRSSLSVEPVRYELSNKSAAAAVTKAQGTYVKHAGTFKEAKSNFTRRLSGLPSALGKLQDEPGLESAAEATDESSRQQQIENTQSEIQFARPLKTSTAVCLNNLKENGGGSEHGEFESGKQNGSKSSSNSSSGAAPLLGRHKSRTSSMEESSGTLTLSSSSSSSSSNKLGGPGSTSGGVSVKSLKKSTSSNNTEESEAEIKRETAAKISYDERGMGESDVGPDMMMENKSQFRADEQDEKDADVDEEQDKIQQCMKSLETKLEFIRGVEAPSSSGHYANEEVIGKEGGERVYVNLEEDEEYPIDDFYYPSDHEEDAATRAARRPMPSPPSKFAEKADDDESGDSSDSSDDDDDDSASEKGGVDDATPKPPSIYTKSRHFVINNSINSQMIAQKDLTYQNVLNPKTTSAVETSGGFKMPFGHLKLRGSKSSHLKSGGSGETTTTTTMTQQQQQHRSTNQVEDFFKEIELTQLERDQIDELEEFIDDEMSMFNKHEALFGSAASGSGGSGGGNKLSSVMRTFTAPFRSQPAEDQTPENPMVKMKRISAGEIVYQSKRAKPGERLQQPVSMATAPQPAQTKPLKLIQNNEKERKMSPTNSTPVISNQLAGQQRQRSMNAQLNLTIEQKAVGSGGGRGLSSRAQYSLKANGVQSASSLQTSEQIYASISRGGGNSATTDHRAHLPNIQLAVPDKPVTGALNLSKLMAIENADMTNTFLGVERTKMPKDLKKTIKEEFTKDRSKCLIQ